jgi:hypothetical protein
MEKSGSIFLGLSVLVFVSLILSAGAGATTGDGVLSGKVYDADSGENISSGFVRSLDGTHIERINSDGNYSISGLSPYTSYTLQCISNGYQNSNQTITTDGFGRGELDFYLLVEGSSSEGNLGSDATTAPPGTVAVGKVPIPLSDLDQTQMLEPIPLPASRPPARETRPDIQIVTQAVDPATNRVYYSYNSAGRQVFRIKVLVTGPDKFDVRSVRYQLHPTFSPSEYTSYDPYNDFELELWTWGAFDMPITVAMKDGAVYEYDYYFTFGDLLRDAQRRGVPFVQVR